MSYTERRDAAERIAALERLSSRVTRYEGRRSDVIVPVENLAGADLEHGSAVAIAGIRADGVIEVEKPSEDSDKAFLGYIVGKLLAGAIGRCQIAGLADAIRDKTTSTPAAGDAVGTIAGSAVVSSAQVGAGKFLGDTKDLGYTGYCLVQLSNESRFVVDHAHGTDTYPPSGVSTEIVERNAGGAGVDWSGYSHDILKVIAPGQSGKATTRKAAIAAAQSGGHNEGWVWADEIAETTPGGQFGWGRIWDLIGVEAVGLSKLNLKTWGEWNDGAGNVGPIDFNGAQGAEPGTGPWISGSMVYGMDGEWHPAIQVETTWPEQCTPKTPQVISLPCDCNCLDDPQAYQMQVREVIGPYRASDSLDNYISIICCLIERQNLIFRLLHVMDCCYGNRWGNFDAWMITNFTSTAGGAPGTTYPDVIQCLVAQVFALSGINCGTVADHVTVCTDVPYGEVGYKDGKCDHLPGE